jgi:hypothetical protein
MAKRRSATPLEELQHWWRKASQKERETFVWSVIRAMTADIRKDKTRGAAAIVKTGKGLVVT